MNLRNPKTLEPIYDQDGVVGRVMVKEPTFEIIHMTLQPKADLKPHMTPFDAEFFAQKGNAVFVIGDKEIFAEEGTIIACSGDIPHGMRNDTNDEITVLVIKKL